MQIDISVVIPIFGTTHIERLFAVIDSLLLQRNISLEVIVSEQTVSSGIPLKKRFPNVVHILSRPDIESGNEVYNAGVARNLGMKHAKGKYIYFNDADILFFDPTYLHRLFQEIQPAEILIRPSMWRMMKEEVPRFLNIYESQGLKAAVSSIVYKRNYLASFSDSVIQLELIEFNERVFSVTPQQLEEYRTNPLLRGQEDLLWQRLVHCGGTFGAKKDIESIGGYAICYPICMYEDSDLQWKLREKFKVREIHKDDTYGVLHLDHELHYRSPSQESFNKDIFEKRISGKVALAIQNDLSRF